MGGAGTNAGTDFQARVAARLAVSGLTRQPLTKFGLGAESRVVRVWCERTKDVDDVVVDTAEGGRVYVQAKTNVTNSPKADSELAKTLEQFVRQFRSWLGGGTGQEPNAKLDRLVLAAGSSGGEPVRKTLRKLLDRARDLGVSPLEADPLVGETNVLKTVVDHVDRIWLSEAGASITPEERTALLRVVVVDDADVLDGEAGEGLAVRDLTANVLEDGASGLSAWTTLCQRLHTAAGSRSGGTLGTFVRWIEANGQTIRSGSQHSAAFVTAKSFYRPLDRDGRLLRHDLPLVGRDDEVAGALAAIGDAATRAVVLPGRGGLGKTRVLRAIADGIEADDTRVVFVREGAVLSQQDFESLPDEPLVVVADDAHQSDLPMTGLFNRAARREGLTVFCAARPAGVQRLRVAASDAGLDAAEVTVLPALTPLAEDDVRLLAAEALDDRPQLADQLAQASSLSPLMTVVGGRLLARPGEHDEQTTAAALRETILLRFSQELLGQVTPNVPRDQARALAEMVAALQPINVGDADLVGAMAGFLGVRASTVRRWVSELQRAGLVLVRGDQRRLTPEVLAEQLLVEACVDVNGKSTGFADELWATFGGRCPAALLANVAALEGHPEVHPDAAPLAHIWNDVERRAEQATIWGLGELLAQVTTAAASVPDRVLGLAERIAGRLPADRSEIEVQILVERLVDAARTAGLEPGSARRAMRLLWQLGRDDSRPLHSHPSHGLRAAQELGGYEQSTQHHDALIQTAREALAEPNVDSFERSPIELFEPLLAREGHTTRPAGLHLQLGSFQVNPDATMQWRREVRQTLIEQAMTGSPRQARFAAAQFEEGLRLPHGYFGSSVSSDILEGWAKDQGEWLDAVDQIERSTDDAIVRHELMMAVQFCTDDPLATVAGRATDLLAKLDSPAVETVGTIASPWSFFDREDKVARDIRVAERLLVEYPDGLKLAVFLDSLVNDVIHRGGNPEAREVLRAVSQRSASHAEAVWRWAMTHPDAAFSWSADVALDALRRGGHDVSELFASGWDSTNARRRRITAIYLSDGAWFDQPADFEIDAVEQAVVDSDDAVRRITATTVLRLGDSQPRLAVSLALRGPTDDEGRDFDMLFAAVEDVGLLNLSSAEINQLCDRLAGVPELGYHATQLMAALAQAHANDAVAVWRRRLLKPPGRDRRITPQHPRGEQFLGGETLPERRSMLDSLLVGMDGLNRQAAQQLGTLLWLMAVPDLRDEHDTDQLSEVFARHEETTEVVRTALLEWVVAAEPPDQVVEGVLNMPWQLVLESAEWIDRLITAIAQDRRDAVVAGLVYAMWAGGHSRTLGQDSPRLTYISMRGDAAAELVPSDSPTANVFRGLAADARKQINKDRESDSNELEGWS